MPKFRRLDDDAIVTVSGDEAVAAFANNPAYAPADEPEREPEPKPRARRKTQPQ